jgi:hypothetical protein
MEGWLGEGLQGRCGLCGDISLWGEQMRLLEIDGVCTLSNRKSVPETLASFKTFAKRKQADVEKNLKKKKKHTATPSVAREREVCPLPLTLHTLSPLFFAIVCHFICNYERLRLYRITG